MTAYGNKLLVVSPVIVESTQIEASLRQSNFFDTRVLSPVKTLASFIKILEFCYFDISAILLAPSAFKSEDSAIQKIQEHRSDLVVFTCENLRSGTFAINQKFGNSLRLLLPGFNKNILFRHLFLESQVPAGKIQVTIEKIHR